MTVARRTREIFSSRFAVLASMIGVAVGLGNVWRFPYMVGQFGGAPFVVVYILAVLLLGVPAMAAEWGLGRHTRRGPVGAFARAGVPLGRPLGWFFFLVVAAAMAYYTNAIGWVLFHALAQLSGVFGAEANGAAILPPDTGFALRPFVLQLVCTAAVILTATPVLIRGLRSGIERVSKWIMPTLLGIVLLLVARTLSLPGALEGVRFYILKFEPSALTGGVVLAAVGQAFFSLALGGTFMVVYGSYLEADTKLPADATWTAGGDLAAGLLAGLAIVPAVVALGFEPNGGPGLIFATLPEVFARIPLGPLVGALFYVALFGAAFLSDVAAFEVLVAGVTDNTRIGRTKAVWLVGALVFVLAIPPMINMRIFVPWDLTFGSGMQTLGALLAVIAFGWFLPRSDALAQLRIGSAATESPGGGKLSWALYLWLRFAVPGAILLIGVWWFLTEVVG